MTPADFKSIRNQLGFSINEMAAALGVHGRVVRYYESGERSISGTVKKLLCYIVKHGVLKEE